MKIGLCTEMENYGTLCEIGYDHIELAAVQVMRMGEGELREAAALIREKGVPCIGFNSYCTGDLPMVGPGFDAGAAREYAAEVCRRGRLLGIGAMGIGAPDARRLPEGYDESLADAQMERFLRVTAEVAQEQGIMLLYEALNPAACDYCVSTPKAAEMVRRLDLPNVRMVLDFYHMAMAGEDVEAVDAFMPLVKHLHINHLGKDGARDYLCEEGMDFYRRAVAAARRCGYDGTLSIEAVTQNFEEDARRSYSILQEILDN